MSRLKKGLALVLTLCMMLSLMPVITPSAKAAETTKPADGITNGQPFSGGTGGSANFRIPALITLSNGNLLAAADARYTITSDGYGLDTMVSYSKDNGSTWNYSYVNYFDDSSGDNSSASAFIDPVLVQGENGTVYLFTDLYPGGGYYIANIKRGTGFTTVDGTSYLALYSSTSATSSTTPAYYVANERNSDGYYTVYDYSSKTASGYALDAEYNIYNVVNGTYTAVTGTQIDNSSTTINANVFYTGTANQSGLYVLGTEYITMRKGTVNTDGSITWGGLELLNVKNDSEYFYGFGPGGGIVTSTGRIIVPLYTYSYYEGGDGNTSVIYSDNNGATWTRSADVNVQTSEASISEVTVGGTNYLYMFTRHGGYFVSSDNGATWSAQKSVSGITYNTATELSTLTYSKLIDGCPAILLSAPGDGTTSSDRRNGKIFVGLVQSDGSITWKYTYQVNSGIFQYSDLAELPDGSIGLLYEDGSASISYTNLAISTIASGATIGESTTPDPDNPNVTEEKEIFLSVGQTTQETDTTGNYESSYTGEGLNTSIATVTVKGGTTEGTAAVPESKVKATTLSAGTYIIGNGTQWLTLNGSTLSYTEKASEATQWTIAASGNSWTIQSGSYYLYYDLFNSSLSVTDRSLLATSWSYNGTSFYFTIGRTSCYLRWSGSAWEVSTTNSNNGAAYTYTPGQAAVPGSAYTTITIKGEAVGDTSVIVGTTKYIIHVKERGGENSVSVAVGGTIDVNVGTLKEGETVKWSVSDSTCAGMYSDGGNATITGRAVGTTTITATIYDTNDTVVGTYIWNVKVTAGSKPNAGSYTVTFSFDCTIYNGTLYYSIDGGPLKQAVVDTTANDTANGEVGTTYTVQEVDQNVAYASIVWFVKPNEGYAVTTVGADESSSSQFYALDKENKTFTYGENHTGGRIENFLTEAEEKAMLEEAISLGCDAVFWNSRGSESGHLNASTTASGTYVIHCDKLPTITKKVAYLKHGDEYTAYSEGMNAVVDDSIVFEIVVTTYNESGTGITYSDAYMKDVMSGITGTAKLYNNKQGSASQELTPIDNYNITETFNNDGTEGNTHTYYVEYVIQDADLDQQLTNDVTLTYKYQSTYSSGAYGGEANASAKITAVSFDPKDIVVDFGLPVTIDYSGDKAHGRYDLVSGTATYGKVSVEDNKVTYTPNRVLQGIDTVTLTNEKGVNYTFKVYPATTVYYEEGFASYSNGWTGNASKGTEPQAKQVAGSSTDEYGYDDKYANEATVPSNGTQATSTAIGDTATFTFQGTGVDIYANCTTGTGTVMVGVLDEDKNLVKLKVVNTKMQNGDTDATNGQEMDAYNVPIVSITDLDYGKYTVEIEHVKTSNANPGGNVALDGFRVYGTLQDQNNTVYKADLEDNPTFIELRDEVLAALSATKVSEQVYAGDPSDIVSEGAIILDNTADKKFTDTNDLLNNGPKNEIYLQKDQALVFTVKTEREVQIGLKALDQATSYTISKGSDNRTSTNLKSSTDMFYMLASQKEATDGLTITISNNGEGILAITKLKICDDPNATLGTLTAEDLIPALVSLGIGNTAEESGGSGSSGGSAGGGGGGAAAPVEPSEPTTPPAEDDSLPFTDVTGGDWFRDSVKYVYSKGLMNGTGETAFSPQQTTNRAMIVTILHRLENSPAPDGQAPFADVPADQYYANPVAWAAANGIVTGTSDTTFSPLNNITREQLAAILYRYAQSKGYDVSVGEDTNILSFTDAETISEYAIPAIQWAVGAGLINGKGDGRLDPQGSATRAEVSAILARFCEAYAG